MAETRKILELDEKLGISATCARVPVFVGHSQSVNVQTRDQLSPEECRELLSAAPAHCSSTPRVRPSIRWPPTLPAATKSGRADPPRSLAPRCLNLWIVGDNLRKGAATNAVQVAEVLHQRDLIRVRPAPQR